MKLSLMIIQEERRWRVLKGNYIIYLKRKVFVFINCLDDFESEELNKIAKIVLDRINDKLQGTDFLKTISLDIKSQVDKLINQATSHENLSQSYLGWCPFW